MLSGPDLEFTHAFPELAPLQDATSREHWSTVSDLLRGFAERGPDSEIAAAAVVAETPGALAMAQVWRAATPEDPMARAITAYAHIVKGWEVRTGHLEQYVKRDAWDTFHTHLRHAEVELIRLCAERPEWLLPWHLRLMTVRGLELGRGEARRRFERLRAHHPSHFRSQSQLMQILLPKWGGDWSESYEFAREAERLAPGTSTSALIPIYHLERWLEEGATGGSYISSPQVQQDLDRSAVMGVWRASYAGGYDSITAHTAYAFCYALAGNVDAATTHWERLGPYADKWLSGYVTASAADFVAKSRERAGVLGDRA